MSRILIAEGTAASAVNTDIMNDSEVGQRERIRSYPRFISRVAFTGSAAAGDSAIVLKVSGQDVSGGPIYVSRTGAVVADLADWIPINAVIPAGEPLAVVIYDATATNIGYVHLDISPM